MVKPFKLPSCTCHRFALLARLRLLAQIHFFAHRAGCPVAHHVRLHVERMVELSCFRRRKANGPSAPSAAPASMIPTTTAPFSNVIRCTPRTRLWSHVAFSERMLHVLRQVLTDEPPAAWAAWLEQVLRVQPLDLLDLVCVCCDDGGVGLPRNEGLKAKGVCRDLQIQSVGVLSEGTRLSHGQLEVHVWWPADVCFADGVEGRVHVLGNVPVKLHRRLKAVSESCAFGEASFESCIAGCTASLE